MLNNFVGKDIINIGDMTPDQFQYLLDLSKMLKAEKMTGVDHARFHNKNVVAHFEWESHRKNPRAEFFRKGSAGLL